MERQEKIVSRLGFIGRERDFESDYFALGARQYDAETGRFLSVAPLFESFDAHTPYHYAYNSPIKYKDPSGLMTISDVETGKQILNALYGEKRELFDVKFIDSGLSCDEEQSNWDNLYFQDNYELDPWDYLSTGALYLSYGGGGGSEENEENTNKESEPVNEGERTGEESGETENGNGKTDSNWSLKGFLKNIGTVTNLFFNWLSGSGGGADNTEVFVNDEVTAALKNSIGVSKAREYFYDKYEDAESYEGANVTDFGGEFGLSGILKAGLDPVEQFVGRSTIDIYAFGDNLTFILWNKTSMTSFLYGMGPSWKRSDFKNCGNYYQFYIWNEPLRKSK